MIRALQLVFAPLSAWQAIAGRDRGVLAILGLSVLPLLIASTAAEGYALVHWGERMELGLLAKFTPDAVLRYGVARLILDTAAIVLSGLFLQLAARGFNFKVPYRSCFTVTGFGYTVFFLTRFLDMIPALHPWICWGIAAALSFSILYHGVPLVLRPDQTKGFGLYMMSVLILVISSGLSHFVTRTVLYQEGASLAGVSAAF